MTLRDSKGMHDLAALLAGPGRERLVLDLWSDPVGPGTGPAQAPAGGYYRERDRSPSSTKWPGTSTGAG